MKKILSILVIILLLFSCQEEVELNLKEMEPVPVIEANWTDFSEFNKVKISFSKDYYDSTSQVIYKDAEVFLEDSVNGKRIEFQFDNQKGAYFPIGQISGEIGHQYILNVNMEGQSYRASGLMLDPPVLDSITYTYKEARALRPAGYYLKVYGKIPFQKNNYYRIVTFKNHQRQESPSEFFLFDDTFGTSLLDNGFELENMPFQAGDVAYLALFRLNEGAYKYMNELLGMIINDGGLFSPPPQNPPSNIELIEGDQPALGYFLVSPVLTEKVEIKEKAD